MMMMIKKNKNLNKQKSLIQLLTIMLMMMIVMKIKTINLLQGSEGKMKIQIGNKDMSQGLDIYNM